ncbi:hypothetical protein THOM_1576 [Trachipleistophora hominis]|uniref:Uncharacterized protein n=1 Tax=Trachipleistophora hominis TaxID=72359 RepID=L7JXJ0_TRAHO|nr:hypothetical protein THOM_1576 [Trachipleistophora hominis]
MLRFCLFVLFCFSSYREINPFMKASDDVHQIFLIGNKGYEKESFTLTIFDTDNDRDTFFPVGLSKVSEKTLPFQLFNSNFESQGLNFYLTWNGDKNIYVVPEGDYLQARKGSVDIRTGMTMHSILSPSSSDQQNNSSLFVKIMYGGKCLEALKWKSKYRNAYPLKFLRCSNSEYQVFKLINVIKAICHVSSEKCMYKNEDSFRATEALRAKLHRFAIPG